MNCGGPRPPGNRPGSKLHHRDIIGVVLRLMDAASGSITPIHVVELDGHVPRH
jgi:hypothetical protein